MKKDWKIPGLVSLALFVALCALISAARSLGPGLLDELSREDPAPHRRVSAAGLKLLHDYLGMASPSRRPTAPAVSHPHILPAGARSGGCLLRALEAESAEQKRLVYAWLSLDAYSLRLWSLAGSLKRKSLARETPQYARKIGSDSIIYFGDVDKMSSDPTALELETVLPGYRQLWRWSTVWPRHDQRILDYADKLHKDLSLSSPTD